MLNVHEGLHMLFAHYKSEEEVALKSLEPIGTNGVEDRQICGDCGKKLEKFAQALTGFTLVSNKDSVCFALAGDLEAEKEDLIASPSEEDFSCPEIYRSRSSRISLKEFLDDKD